MDEEKINTDPSALVRITERVWKYLTSEELWDFIISASIEIIAILLVSILSYL